MSVGILLVTHGKLGHFLLDTMRELMGLPEHRLPLAADVLEVRTVQSHEALLNQGAKLLEKLDSGAGVLLLTDAFGSTPSNIANKLSVDARTQVVAGVNLPMLVSVFNYPKLSLVDMSRKAVEGGQRGIVACPGNKKT